MEPSAKESRILSGSLVFAMLRFGAPLALGMAMQNAFNLIDAWLVAELPADESSAGVGALGVCDQIAAIGTIASYGISTGTATLIAQRQGAGDEEGVRRLAWQSILVVLGLSLVFAFLAPVAPWLLGNVVGLKGAVLAIASKYLQIILPGGFTMFFLLHFAAIQRALGSAKTPAALLVLGNALNLALAVVMMFGEKTPHPSLAFGAPIARALHLAPGGMIGTAWATVIARFAVLIPNVLVLIRRFDLVPKEKRPDPALMREIFDQAWPSSVVFVLRVVAVLFINSVAARFYSTQESQSASTAMGLVFRVDTVALFVAMGWGSAAQTFVGQNIGAHNPERAKTAGAVAAAWDLLTSIGIWLGVRWIGFQFLSVFGRDQEAIAIGMRYLVYVAPSYLALGIAVVLGNAMVGAGAARLTLKVDAGVFLLFQVPLCLAVAFSRADMHWLFVSVAVTAFVSCLVYLVVYRRGLWLPKPVAQAGP
jgi:putative MATE family efflux protein